MKKILAMLLALTMVFALCACGSSAAPAATEAPAASEAPETTEEPAAEGDAVESDLAYVQAQGKLIVGITDFAPMDYKDDAGEWIGFDADMAKAFAESIGVDVEFIEIDWDNKIMELDAKSIDCVWNGMTLTDEVMNSMECSDPYWKNAQVVVVNSDVAADYATEESLEGLVFAVEAGSAGENAAKELGNEYNAVQTQADALMEVAAGTSDACIIDLSMANAMIGEGTSYDQLTYTVELTSEVYGVGFRKGSDLAAAYNEFYAAAFADGTVEEIATVYDVQGFLIG